MVEVPLIYKYFVEPMIEKMTFSFFFHEFGRVIIILSLTSDVKIVSIKTVTFTVFDHFYSLRCVFSTSTVH